jgi:hypothetical protein
MVSVKVEMGISNRKELSYRQNSYQSDSQKAFAHLTKNCKRGGLV